MGEVRREFNDLVFGNPDCPIPDVLEAIEHSISFARLHVEWTSLARHLELPDYIIYKFTDEFVSQLRIKTLPQLVDELLKTWKAEKGDQAKLADLCGAFEKSGLRDISQSLYRKFSDDCPPKEQKFIWRGKLFTLEELVGQDEEFGEPEDKRIIEPEGTPLIKPHVAPPTQPKYYVPRTLFHIPSYELDPTIFLSESTKNHVFLFQDETKCELAKLTQYKFPIELSGDQLYRLTARFIILDCVGDYNRICRNRTDPVHMIKRQDEHYSWVRSSAALDVIKRFLKNSPMDISEEELVNKIMTTPSPCSLSIGDSPGMGKTFVMTNLATEIQERSSEKTIHLFIVLQEFVQQLNLVESSETTLEAIAAYCSYNHKTKHVLIKMLKKYFQVYLFLDGYDEVMQDKMDKVDGFLRNLQELKNFKVIVTTRPHMKTRLELIFHQFSYEIHPFIESDQIDFLTRYWVDQHGAKDCEVLEQFAGQCLSALQNNMSDKERDITGIPLQCMILGEVYAEDAKRAGLLKSLRPNSIEPITLVQMYKRLVNLKLSRIPEASSKQKFQNAHVHEAMRLLFPDWIDRFKPILGEFDNIDETKMYSIGLVEPSPTGTPRFLHRTFAEYLLAEFIVMNLRRHRQCVEFLFGGIMGRKGTIHEACGHYPTSILQYDCAIVIFLLRFPVVGYFIDMHLKDTSVDELLISNSLESKKLDVEDVYAAVRACCCNDLENTFNYATQLLLHHDFSNEAHAHLRDNYFQDLPHVTVRRCKNARILQKLLEFMNQLFGVDLSYHVKGRKKSGLYTPLHEAVYQGNYNIAAWLVQQYGDQVHKLNYLLHTCVRGSDSDSDSVVKDKMLIIDMLASINRKWVEERDVDECTPLLQGKVHMNLLQHLVHTGADINAYASGSGTILHQFVSGNKYMELVRWTFSNGFKLVNTTNKYGWTPLMYAIRNCEPLNDEVSDISAVYESEMTEIFLQAGANLNAQDAEGNLVWFYALKSSGNVDIIKKLIKLGVDVNHKNNKNQNALHTIMLRNNIPTGSRLATIDMLVEINPVWVNENDKDECTPLLVHCSRLGDFGFDLRLLQRLVEHGADINACSREYGTVLHSDCDKDTYMKLVHWAFSNGFYLVDHKDKYKKTAFMHALGVCGTLEDEVLQLFLDASVDLNAKDQEGNSVLFYALKYSGNVEFIKRLVERGADVKHKNNRNQNVLHRIMLAYETPTENRLAALSMMVEINGDLINENDEDGFLPLLVYCRGFDEFLFNLKLLQRLVELGADINACSSKYGTVLHSCCYEDTYANLARWAFSNGFNLVNHRNKDNETSLMLAIKRFRTLRDEVLQLFVGSGSDLNAKSEWGDSVLFYALKFSRKFYLVKTLIELGADVKHKNNRNQNSVHTIMLARDIPTETRLATLDMVVETNRDLINEKDEDGCLPLLVYCKGMNTQACNLRLLQRVVEHGADINACSSKYGTVLHSCCGFDKDNYTKLVCWAFANGFSLIFAEEYFGTLSKEVLQLFQEAGAEIGI